MTNHKSVAWGLLKYPIITISIVLALLMAKWWLGFDLSMVSEIGTKGVIFREAREATSEALTELEMRLNEGLDRLATLENRTGLQPPSVDSPPVLVTNETARSTDAIARLAKLSSEGSQTIFKGKVGYIWLGNYDSNNNKWDNPMLLVVDSSKSVEVPPFSMAPGSRYKVSGNIVLRAGLPKNDEEYFRGQRSIGTVPRGTLIELLEKPIGIDREFAVQFWVKIEVAE